LHLFLSLKVSPILVIIIAALLGAILYNKQPLDLAGRVTLPNKSHTPKSLFMILSVTAIGFGALYFLDRKLFDLATLMFRIDLFAFGGGFASVPLMFHEVVEVRQWLNGPTLLNGIALGQVTPGPIVITATFIGYLLEGPFGGLIATISVFLPSFMIVVGIVPYFDRLRSSPYFKKVITGILCSFVGLLLTVTIRFALDIPWDLPRILLTVAAFVALILKVDILWVVLAGTVISLIVL
jgi:chromate transporter